MNEIRVAGYGRLSFDDPNRRTSSVADQETAARRYCEQHGWALEAWHADHGVTGATMQRNGLQALLALVQSRRIDVLIIEDVDRLSRDQEHLQFMAKLFRVYDVRLHAVAIGPVEDIVLAVKGLIAEEQRRRIAYTTRRGLVGKARRRGTTGGKTLGYIRAVIGVDDEGSSIDRYVVVAKEADIVRRIFDLYAAGHSLKAICDMLDAEGVPPPSATWRRSNKVGRWNPSSLSGNVERGEGILNNRAYIGERTFNRRRWVEVPTESRGFKRQPRLNDQKDWVLSFDPEQRIIDEALWDSVKERQAEARAARDQQFNITGNPLAGAKRAAHLLSELVWCGACGSKFTATGAGRWRCRNHRGGACTNGSVSTKELEDRVFAGIRERLLTPPLVSRFAAQLQTELDALGRDDGVARDRVEVELVDTRARIAKLVRRIEEDDDAPRSLVDRLRQLEKTEAALSTELSASPEPDIIRLPTNYELIYTRAIAELEGHLDGIDGASSRSAVRALIERVIVQPGDARGGKRRPLQLEGDLFGMLAFAERASAGSVSLETKHSSTSRSERLVIPVVAGTRFHLNLRFRLIAISAHLTGAMPSPALFARLFATLA